MLHESTPGGVVHLWEYREALATIARLQSEVEQLKKYAKYIANRMQSQAEVINEELNTIIAASMLDDLDDAAIVAGIEPRKWK